jgi:hypothetical protein
VLDFGQSVCQIPVCMFDEERHAPKDCSDHCTYISSEIKVSFILVEKKKKKKNNGHVVHSTD